jgi:hypothetical protein
MGIDRLTRGVDRQRIPDLGKDPENFPRGWNLFVAQVRLVNESIERRLNIFVAGS